MLSPYRFAPLKRADSLLSFIEMPRGPGFSFSPARPRARPLVTGHRHRWIASRPHCIEPCRRLSTRTPHVDVPHVSRRHRGGYSVIRYSIHFVTLQARGFPSHDVQWFRPNLVYISYALREAAQGADERWTLTALTRHASRRSALYRPQVAAAWRDPRGAWGASYFCTVNVCMSVCNVGNSTINVLWKLALFCLDLV